MSYAFASTPHGSVTDTDAEAGDSGGYVDGAVGTDCGPK